MEGYNLWFLHLHSSHGLIKLFNRDFLNGLFTGNTCIEQLINEYPCQQVTHSLVLIGVGNPVQMSLSVTLFT